MTGVFYTLRNRRENADVH